MWPQKFKNHNKNTFGNETLLYIVCLFFMALGYVFVNLCKWRVVSTYDSLSKCLHLKIKRLPTNPFRNFKFWKKYIRSIIHYQHYWIKTRIFWRFCLIYTILNLNLRKYTFCIKIACHHNIALFHCDKFWCQYCSHFSPNQEWFLKLHLHDHDGANSNWVTRLTWDRKTPTTCKPNELIVRNKKRNCKYQG